MMGRNHKIIGFASGFSIAVLSGFDPAYVVASTVVGGFGAMLPDIDHHGSTVSRKLSFLRFFIAPMLQHRGPTHSLLFILLLFYGCYTYRDTVLFGLSLEPLLWGFFAGYVSHIMSDMLTKSGVYLAWPIQSKFGIPLIRTNSKLEPVITMLIVVGLIIVPFYDRIFGFIQSVAG